MIVPEKYKGDVTLEPAYVHGYQMGKKHWELDDAYRSIPTIRLAYLDGFRAGRQEDRDTKMPPRYTTWS